MLDRGRHRNWSRGGGAGYGGMMQTASRMFPNDVELGKKDDDHKPPRHSSSAIWRRPLRYRKRRIFLTIACCFILWQLSRSLSPYFNITESDVLSNDTPWPGSLNYEVDREAPVEPSGPPPSPLPSPTPADAAVDGKQFYYDGEIRFFRLSSTLNAAASTMGYRFRNRNIIFAASDLKSVSTLITMACEMTKWDRNYVHMVIMGRDSMPLEDILEVNGVDKDTCRVMWHDARPEYAEYSTEARAEDSVMSAVGHIHSFLHPQVIITDDPLNEDEFFARGIRSKAKYFEIPVIEIPKDASDKLMWITRLDSGSLRNWNRPSVDLLIQAPAKSSGSLIRLLKSLYAADFSGNKPPRLIIDLPADMDPVIKQFLESFVWPPPSLATQNTLSASQLILHHRILSRRASPEEASARFLESFYPTQPTDSHVLVLSPQAQLSPLFYHYIRYNLLEYRYSAHSDSSKLFGISLELPSKYLNGTTEFEAPKTDPILESKYKAGPGVNSVPFLWDAPNSNAALYFGYKWVEMHSFLTYRLAVEEDMPAKPIKVMPQTLPAWTEYALEFMRARGYYVLYPGSLSGESLVTVHHELPDIPEEFDIPPSTKAKDTEKDEERPEIPDDGVLHATPSKTKPSRVEPNIAPSSRALHDILPFSGELPELNYLPRLSYSGQAVDFETALSMEREYEAEFRKVIGGCDPAPEGFKRKFQESTRDLFCFGDETEDDFEEDYSTSAFTRERSRFGMPFEQSPWSDDNSRRINREEELEVTSSFIAAYATPTYYDAGISSSSLADAAASPTEAAREF